MYFDCLRSCLEPAFDMRRNFSTRPLVGLRGRRRGAAAVSPGGGGRPGQRRTPPAQPAGKAHERGALVVAPIEFATHTELADGLRRLIQEFQRRTDLREPIEMFIAGGMATHLYTAARVTTDVDAEFSKRILLPSDLIVETKDGNPRWSRQRLALVRLTRIR